MIAKNVSLSAIHKRASEPSWSAKAITLDLPDATSSCLHSTFESEQSRRTKWRFIMDTLDQTEAKVMLLHYGRELPLNQVSRMLGLSNKSGAKAYIVSARRKLTAAVSLNGKPQHEAGAASFVF